MEPSTKSDKIVCFDFGTAYIRAVKARLDGGVDVMVEPQIVEFDGRPELANRLLLSADKAAPAIIGDNVLHTDLSGSDIAQPYWGLTIEEDSGGELGRASTLLLAHIVSILTRDHGLIPSDPKLQVLVAVPSAARANVGPRLEERLRQAGFSDVAAHDSVLAALAHYAGNNLTGRYIVIDLGASETRLALIETEPGQPPAIIDSSQVLPGGRDFDRALLDHFETQFVSEAGEEEIELEARVCIEMFKRDFSQAWTRGESSYSGIYRVGFDYISLGLDCSTFQSEALAGPLIEQFRQAADAFVDRHSFRENLTGLVLVGGGAHWPFVVKWAEDKAGHGRVISDEYAEEAIVRGLSQLAVPQQSLPEATISVPPTEINNNPPNVTRVTKPSMSPATAFVLEFVGGVVGILGLGWFFGRRQVAAGCLALIIWWIVLITLLAMGIYGAAANRPAWMAGLVVLWLVVPFTSAFVLSRSMSDS